MVSMVANGNGWVYRVSPDYAGSPVWDREGNVDLDELPISAELRAELWAWVSTWERLEGWPPGEGQRVADASAVRKWRRHGQHLATWLQRELGVGARVEYLL